MWKYFCVLFLCIVPWCYGFSDDCVTPLGKRSKCVSLYDCDPLVYPLKERSMSTHVFSFLQKSHCGFQGYLPKVCCGPIPLKKSDKVSAAFVSDDEYSSEDSKLASRDQCGVNKDGDKIYGGEMAETDDFPWMALLGYKKSAGIILYKCGGSLINRRYVLTAAHCINGYDKNKYGLLTSVRLGEHDMSAKSDCQYTSCESRLQEIAVGSAYAYPYYNTEDRSVHYDIGIVRLAKRATYTYYVQPICLVDNVDQPMVGDNAVIAGLGKTLSGSFSTVKRKLHLTIYDKDTCIRQFLKLGVSLGDRQICAGGILNEDACIKDSGGPLMMKSLDNKWEAVGIISFGNGCGRQGWPGVYTSVGGFLDWISETLLSTNHHLIISDSSDAWQ